MNVYDTIGNVCLTSIGICVTIVICLASLSLAVIIVCSALKEVDPRCKQAISSFFQRFF